MIHKRKYLFGIIVVIAILVSIAIISYKNIQPYATERDITVEGVLELNKTGINNDKEYLLTMQMAKNKDCNIAVYPYIDGLGLISFSDKDKRDYYVPGSIGSDGITEPIASNELKNKNYIEKESDVSLYGFWFPDEVGQYKARIYIDKLDTFKEIKNPVLVCVYTEKKYGKQLNWSMVVPIIVQ